MKEAKAQKDLWDELRAAEAALDAAERRFDQAADELKFARKNALFLQRMLSDRLHASK
jgi:hypothetical protein